MSAAARSRALAICSVSLSPSSYMTLTTPSSCVSAATRADAHDFSSGHHTWMRSPTRSGAAAARAAALALCGKPFTPNGMTSFGCASSYAAK